MYFSYRGDKMKGEVVFTSYSKAGELDLSKFDYRLQIVRYTTKGLKAHFHHFPAFSPSERLFNKTKRHWKRLKFTAKEKEIMAKGKTGTWFDLYEIHFVQEKAQDKLFQEGLQALIQEINQGKNFLMICYCEDLDRCHRKVVADIFKEAGVPVRHV